MNQNAAEREYSNQHDRDRHDEGDRQSMTTPTGIKLFEVIPMFPRGAEQSQGAEGDQRQSKISRRVGAPHTSAGFLEHILKKLVDAEPESNHG